MKEISTKKLVETIIEGIRNRKGQCIVTIDLQKIKEAPVEYMVIAEGNSATQVAAIADEVDDYVRTTRSTEKIERDNSGGSGSSGGSSVDSDGFGGSSGGKF